MKWSVDSRLAQHWTFLLCDNEDDEQRATDSLSLSLTLNSAGFYPPWLSRTQTAYTNCFSHLPSSQPERRQRLAWTYSRREPTDQRIYSTVRQKKKHLLERSIWSVSLSVCLSDRSTTLPQLHSQRLQWEITFLVNLIFFLSGLTFH